MFWVPERHPRPLSAATLSAWEARLGVAFPESVRDMFALNSDGQVLRNAIVVDGEYIDLFFPTGPSSPENRAWTTLGDFIDGNELRRGPASERGWDLDKLVFLAFPGHTSGVLLDYSESGEPGVIAVRTNLDDDLSMEELARFPSWRAFSDALVSYHDDHVTAVAVYTNTSVEALKTWLHDNDDRLDEWELDVDDFSVLSNSSEGGRWSDAHEAQDVVVVLDSEADVFMWDDSIAALFHSIASDLDVTCDIVEAGDASKA